MPAWWSAVICATLVAASLYGVWSFYQPRWGPVVRSLLGAACLEATVSLAAAAVRLHAFPAITVASFGDLLLWLVAGVLAAAMRRDAWLALGGFVVPVLTLLWVASQLPVHGEPAAAPAALTGAWLAIHVVLATASYGAFLLSAGAALMYLEKERELRRRVPRVFYYRLPALAESDALSARLVAVGLPLLTCTIVTGAVWSKVVTGAYWSWTAVETWSLITWVVYAAYLGFRWRRWRGHRAAWLSLGALLVVAVNFFGVTLLFHGWHDYGA